MRAFLLACLLAALALASQSERASAQFTPGQPYQPYRPLVSPYLNLARPGNPGINYFGLVKPQIDVNRQLQQLQQQQQLQQTQLGMGFPQEDGSLAPYAITGHATSFFNYGHYYYQGLGSSGGAVPYATAPIAPQVPFARRY